MVQFVRIPLGEGKEPVLADEGDYDLVVRRAEFKETKRGGAMLVVLFAFDGKPSLKAFRQYFVYPSDEGEQGTRRVRELRRFLNAFGVEFDDSLSLPWTDEPGAFDITALQGATGSGHVVVEEGDGEYGDSNRARFAAVPGE